MRAPVGSKLSSLFISRISDIDARAGATAVSAAAAAAGPATRVTGAVFDLNDDARSSVPGSILIINPRTLTQYSSYCTVPTYITVQF